MLIDEPYNKLTLDLETKILLENEYNSDKLTFLFENNDKTELDFIKSRIENISFQIKERERKFNLSDDEFYQEFRYVDKNEEVFIHNGDEAESIKEFFENRNSYHKVYYHNNNYIDLELIYYKIKFQGLTNLKYSQNIKVDPNPFPQIFAGLDNKNYLLFINYTKHIIDPYADYSFIFQKMFKDGNRILKGVKHLDFMEWLNENNLISPKIYIELKDKGFFATQYLIKAERNNNYNLIVEHLFKQC